MNTSNPQFDTDARTIIDFEEGQVPVIARGQGWLVVDKPSGLSVHNDPGRDLCSAVLSAVRAGRLPGVDCGFGAWHAVHRLDRETSGIVVMAGDSKTVAFFCGQFSARSVQKKYLALVHGHLQGHGGQPDQGYWDWPLTAAASGRDDPVGKGKHRHCITRWRILARSLHYSLIECEPLTGRKHQIRRHAKLAGHPVVGDRRYGSVRSLAYLSRYRDFNRLGLHAHALTIRLPGMEQPTTFQTAEMPKAMRQLLEHDH
jgi:RluA family pseudouridine synthase